MIGQIIDGELITMPRHSFRHSNVVSIITYEITGIQHAGLIDPIEKTPEVYRLEAGRWVLFCVHSENDHVHAEPFQVIENDLEYLW